MKVLLVAVDSKYSHSNLAVRYLKAYTRDLPYICEIEEFTINDRVERVVEELILKKPDMLAFSCYIWNVEFIVKIVETIHLIQPEIKILYGGPEVSYNGEGFLHENKGDFLIQGEGEETYKELIEWIIGTQKITGSIKDKTEEVKELNKILGLYYKFNDKVYYGGNRPLMEMDNIAFPYLNEEIPPNKIVYYEASRGCPFLCKYCISSTSHGVRFLNIERVKAELKDLINRKVGLIKFVDRTFNCNSQFAREIWEYLINMETSCVFHFEISADLLKEEELELLKTAPPGRFQFEVGVQTTNENVLKDINRFVNFSSIKEKVEELLKIKNIMQHLDLIAGLPGEDFGSFKKSFNDVYTIAPQEIQLGFLKLLKGSAMRTEAKKWGMVYSPYPPYEILKTSTLSYEELITLKRVEEVVDRYYNSGRYKYSLDFMMKEQQDPFEFYYRLGMYFYENGYLSRSVSNSDYYNILIDFNKNYHRVDDLVLKEILKYEFLLYNKKKWVPEILNRVIDKNKEIEMRTRIKTGEIQVSKKSHIEQFAIDIEQLVETGNIVALKTFVIFDDTQSKIVYFKEL